MLLVFHQRRCELWWPVAHYLALVVALCLPVFHVSTRIHLASEEHIGFVPLVVKAEEPKAGGGHRHHHASTGGHGHHHAGGGEHGGHHHHGSHGHDHDDGGNGSGADSGDKHHHHHSASDHLASFFYIVSPYVVAPMPRLHGEKAVSRLAERVYYSAWDSALQPRAPPGCAWFVG